MIERAALTRFLSGRLLGLAGSLGFQVAVVRLLPTPDYGRYALAIGLAGLVQTLTSLGLPRVAAMFLSGAGERLSHRMARRLLGAILGVRMLACGATFCMAALAGLLLPSTPMSDALIYAGAAYAVLSALQLDADGAAQALGLQVASRRAAVGEPLARLLGVLALWVAGAGLNAVCVLWISAATAGIASAMLLRAAFGALSVQGAKCGGGDNLDWAHIRSVAIGGYGGTLSWLAFSPAVIRVIASRILPVEVFAGFSFVQTLAISLQRYAPSFTLFPLIEPAAMADAVRSGRPDRLRTVLSLLVKADAIMVGAAIVGVATAGAAIVGGLARGRYGDAAVFLPWLLAGLIANASHRSYEIAAIALREAKVLTRALGFTVGWFAFALVLAPSLGVWPLLLCPLADALTRFWFVQQALDKRGGGGLLDPAELIRIAAAVVAMSVIGALVARSIEAGLVMRFCIGTTAAVAFLGLVTRLQPFRPAESRMLQAAAPWLKRVPLVKIGARSNAFRVVVLTPRGRGGVGGVDRLMDSLRAPLAARQGVRVTFITTRGPSRWASPLVSGLALLRLAAASALGRTDVIHVNLGAHRSCYRKMVLIAIPMLLGTPVVIHLHGSAFEGFWVSASPWAQRRIDGLFRNAAHVIVLGSFWHRLVAGRVPEMNTRITVLPNATAAFETPRRPRADDIQILFLGDLSTRKGSSILLHALNRLETRTPWRAIIAGEGDVAATRRLVDTLGLGDRVTAPGWVGPADVDALLATSDILALPSLEENLPMAVIEAFAAGVAVIATPVGALPDILEHGRTGLMTAPGDAEDLARALCALIDDPALRRVIGLAGKAHHKSHLALEPYIDRLYGLWRNAAATRSRIV